MQRSAWKADSIPQLDYRLLTNAQKVVISQYVDGTAHIAPQGHTFPDRRKIEAKSIDRPSRNTGALGAAVGATLWLIARPDREELRG